MKNRIGGLFKKRKDAERANRALQKAGFQPEVISMLVRKPTIGPINRDRVTGPELGISAGLGALIVGVIGGFLGFLVGRGVIVLPGLEPRLVGLTLGFLLSSILAGIVFGVLTGAILGTAIRLFISNEKVAITPLGIKRGGVLVVVSVNGVQGDESARHVLEDNGAIDVENLTEKWDSKVWSSFQEVAFSRK
jgi:hypothetical protein